MEYAGDGTNVYTEAKGEYTRQLCSFLVPALHTFFLNMLSLAKERELDAKKHLMAFQTLLEAISEWNVDKVQRETQALAMSSQCDYLEELLTAVFIAHTKVLSAIRLTNHQKKLQITIPKLEHFLHRTMTECARLLWSNTYLFATNGAALERQKNMRQIEALITEGVLQGVRGMLPVKSILRKYLATDDEETDTEEGENEEEAEDDVEEGEPTIEEKPEELDTTDKSEKESHEKEVEKETEIKTDISGLHVSEVKSSTPIPVQPSILESHSEPPSPRNEILQPDSIGPQVPTIVLDTVAAIATPPALRTTPLDDAIQEVDDIPLGGSQEPIFDATNSELLEMDMGDVEPLSVADEGGFEFEEL